MHVLVIFDRTLDEFIYLDVQWRRIVFSLMCSGVQGWEGQKKDGEESQGSKSEKVVYLYLYCQLTFFFCSFDVS